MATNDISHRRYSSNALRKIYILLPNYCCNMPSKLLLQLDKLLLRKQAIFLTIVDQLKNISQIEHTRHLSL